MVEYPLGFTSSTLLAERELDEVIERLRGRRQNGWLRLSAGLYQPFAHAAADKRMKCSSCVQEDGFNFQSVRVAPALGMFPCTQDMLLCVSIYVRLFPDGLVRQLMRYRLG